MGVDPRLSTSPHVCSGEHSGMTGRNDSPIDPPVKPVDGDDNMPNKRS